MYRSAREREIAPWSEMICQQWNLSRNVHWCCNIHRTVVNSRLNITMQISCLFSFRQEAISLTLPIFNPIYLVQTWSCETPAGFLSHKHFIYWCFHYKSGKKMHPYTGLRRRAPPSLNLFTTIVNVLRGVRDYFMLRFPRNKFVFQTNFK